MLQVTAVELDADRAAALKERFGDQLDVISADIRDANLGRDFDLVVLDLDSTRIPMIYEELLTGAVTGLVRPGGVVIALVITDTWQAFHGPKAFPLANEELLSSFMDRHFGTRTLSDEFVKSFYADDPHYRALALVDKWRGDPANFIGWLALQRLPE